MSAGHDSFTTMVSCEISLTTVLYTATEKIRLNNSKFHWELPKNQWKDYEGCKTPFPQRALQSDCTDSNHVRFEMPVETFHVVLAIRHPAMGEEGGEADLGLATHCGSLKMHKNHVIAMFTSDDSISWFQSLNVNKQPRPPSQVVLLLQFISAHYFPPKYHRVTSYWMFT